MAEQKNSLLQTAKDLAPWGLAIYGIKKLNDIFGSGSPNDHHQEDAMSDLDKEIAATPGTGTYTKAQFDQFAAVLQSAMEGMGTDENAIYSVMDKMRSKLDVLLLLKSFGIRYYQEFFNVGENYTLAQWFDNELSGSAIDNINEILAGNGINFYF